MAPRVPDDNANAPGGKGVRGRLGERNILVYRMDSQDVFLPKLGPDNWTDDRWVVLVGGWGYKRKGRQTRTHQKVNLAGV